MTNQPVTITRRVWLSLLVPVLSFPTIAIAIGQCCLPAPTWFPAHVAVPAVGAPIYGVQVHREPE